MPPPRGQPASLLAFIVFVIFAFSSSCRSAAAAAAAEDPGRGEGGQTTNSSSSSPLFFDTRLAAAALDLSSSFNVSSLSPPLGLDSSSLDLKVSCDKDRFFPAKRMPATVSLPRLVGKFQGASCRLHARRGRDGDGNDGNDGNGKGNGKNDNKISCSPSKIAWFYQEPLLLPERRTPAALFAGGCSLSLFPSSLKGKQEEEKEEKEKEEKATATTANDDDAFTAPPPLPSSNSKRIQILSPVVVRCESLEAMKRGECAVVERPQWRRGREEEGKKKKEKKKKENGSRKEAISGTSGDSISAGTVAAEVGREVLETLRAF